MTLKCYAQAIELIKPKYKEGFRKFVEKGESSQEFLDYLDRDEKAQEAIDMCFNEQCQNIDKIVRENIPPAKSLGDVLKSLCKR